MRRKFLSLTTLLLALTLLQVSTPFSFATFMPGYYNSTVASVSMDPIPVDTLTMLTFNSTYDSQVYALLVSNPTQFSFNMSLYVDSAPPGPFTSVYFNVNLRGSGTEYIPHLNQQLFEVNQFWSDNWWWLTLGYSDTSYTEFLTIQSGWLILEFDFDWDDPTDQLSVNFTLSQLYDLDTAQSFMWDQDILTSWQDDMEWEACTFMLPEANLYNVSLYGEMDYTTTGSWGGNLNFQPFMDVDFLDRTYGSLLPIDTYNPSFAIPAGAGSGNANWTYWELYKLAPDDYYLFGQIGTFEYLNSSSVSLQMNIEPLGMSMLEINQTINLSFDSTPTGSLAYVGIHAPQMYTYELYFDNHIGANWSVDCVDVDTGWLPPTYAYYEDASSYTIFENRLENSFVFSIPMMDPTPTSSILGNEYLEAYVFGGTNVAYINGSATGATFAPGGYQNTFDTFYIQIIASPFGGTPTSEFNITFNFEAYNVANLLPSGATFAINQTIGPFYQAFALPVISGFEYDLTVWASDYNNSGVVGIFLAPVSQFYLDWQWMGWVPLYQTTPPGLIPMQVTNVNETAGLKFIAVRTTTLFFGLMGVSMSGPPPSDTTEVTANITESAPPFYALGTVVTETIQDTDLTVYSVSIVAGTSYRLSLSLNVGGSYALCSVFDGFGYTPFDASLFTLYLETSSSYLNSSITYQALTSGPVTIFLIGRGTVSFSLTPIGEAPGSFVLGLMIGLIFMIVGVIIVYVVMRRRF